MITEYKSKLQTKLTEAMVAERQSINKHYREIATKKKEVDTVKSGVEEVTSELKSIKENEQEYLRLQKEYYKRVQEQENEENEMHLKKHSDKCTKGLLLN